MRNAKDVNRKKCSSLEKEMFILVLVMGKLPEKSRGWDMAQNRPNSFKDVNVVKKKKKKGQKRKDKGAVLN